MFWYIEGPLKESQPHYVIIETMGLGWQVFIPASTYFHLPRPGQTVRLYTHLQVKDDGLSLFGFLQQEERDFFLLLLGVSGIGPRVAISLLGHLTLPRITAAILVDDIKSLTSVPGIGAKTARRLVYELKEKINGAGAEEIVAVEGQGSGSAWADLQQALLSLGYSQREIQKVRQILTAEEDAPLEVLFKKALALLSR